MTARTGWRQRAVTVNAVTAPGSIVPVTANIRLCGWSLLSGDIAGLSNTGAVTSPAAGAAIANLAAVPAGNYTVSWLVELTGAAAGPEVNNFGLYVGAALQATSVNPGAAGSYQQEPVGIVVPAGGAAVSVKAIALGTVGVTYTATETLSGPANAQAQILDGGQILGFSAPQNGASDTQWLTDDGIFVSGPVTVKALQGTVSGILYVTDADIWEGRDDWPATKSMSSP